MVKMLPLISSCKVCPNYGYYSGGRHDCKLVDTIIPNSDVIPSFCPLPDYPAARMSRIEETLRQMQRGEERPFVIDILLLIAAKLKSEIGHYGEVIVRTEDGSVALRWDAITSISPADSYVEFFGADSQTYRLRFGQSTALMVAKKVPEFEEELWTEVPLAK